MRHPLSQPPRRSAPGDNLFITASSGAKTLTLTSTISASNITVTADTIATATGSFLTGNGTITVKPFSNGTPIDLATSVIGGALTLTQGVLSNSTASTFVIGDAAQNDLITIDTTNLKTPTAGNYDLQFHTTGQYTFIGSLTLVDDHTLTLDGASAIVNTIGGTDITIGGNGTLSITGLHGNANVGNLSQPLTTAIANLNGVSGSGHLFISNTGGLDVNGDVAIGSGASATGNEIITHSPLSINANVSVAGDLLLAAGNNTVTSGDDLTINANVHSGGNTTMTAGDGIILTAGNITSDGGFLTLTANNETSLTDAGLGSIAQTGGGIQVATVNATATTGIFLSGNNQIGTFSALNNGTVGNATIGNGTIKLVNTSTIALPTLQLANITQNFINGSITIVNNNGPVTQVTSTTISAPNNADLTVQTVNPAGSTITLTNANDLGTGKATLQVWAASNGTTATANVSFTTSGQMHLQQIQSNATVTLQSTTLDQDLTDPVGIQAVTLHITSAGATNLTNTNNTFSILNVTDTAAGDLSYTTNSSTDPSHILTITGFTQNLVANDTINNANGSIFSNVALTGGNMTLLTNGTATGGIQLLNDFNSFQTVTADNPDNGLHLNNGDIEIHQGSPFFLTVPSLNEVGGGTTLISSVGIGITGVVSTDRFLLANVTIAGGTYLTTLAANITSGGPVTIIADHMSLNNPASTLTAAGQIVTLVPLTKTETIAINGNDSAGVLGLLNSELATINGNAGKLVIGSFVALSRPPTRGTSAGTSPPRARLICRPIPCSSPPATSPSPPRPSPATAAAFNSSKSITAAP